VAPDLTGGVPLDGQLDFAKFTQTVIAQNADGFAGQPIVTTFDDATNRT
jgi:hypothetical protein